MGWITAGYLATGNSQQGSLYGWVEKRLNHKPGWSNGVESLDLSNHKFLWGSLCRRTKKLSNNTQPWHELVSKRYHEDQSHDGKKEIPLYHKLGISFSIQIYLISLHCFNWKNAMKIQNLLWFAVGLWFFMEPRSHPRGMTIRVNHHRRQVRPSIVTAVTFRQILTQLEISKSQQRPHNRQHGKMENKRIIAKAIKVISGLQQPLDPLTQPICRISLRPVRSPWEINQKLFRTATAVERAFTKSLQRIAHRESQRHECPTPKVKWTPLVARKITIYCPKWIK